MFALKTFVNSESRLGESGVSKLSLLGLYDAFLKPVARFYFLPNLFGECDIKCLEWNIRFIGGTVRGCH